MTQAEVPAKEHWWWDTEETNDGGAVFDRRLRLFFEDNLKQRAPRIPHSFTLTVYNPASMGPKVGLSVLQTRGRWSSWRAQSQQRHWDAFRVALCPYGRTITCQNPRILRYCVYVCVGGCAPLVTGRRATVNVVLDADHNMALMTTNNVRLLSRDLSLKSSEWNWLDNGNKLCKLCCTSKLFHTHCCGARH